MNKSAHNVLTTPQASPLSAPLRGICRLLVMILAPGYVSPDVFDQLPIALWWLLLVPAIALPFLLGAL